MDQDNGFAQNDVNTYQTPSSNQGFSRGDNPKIGLTMRQPGLGKLEWIKEDAIKKQKAAEKALKAESKATKKK